MLVVLVVRAALVEAAPIERAAALLVLQGPQMSEAVQAHQKAAPADQVDQVGQVVRLAAEAELAALAQLALRADQVALAVQAVLAATLLPVQAELVVQAESAAEPVLAELVEMLLLFLRPAAEAAGYSYLFRPWLPLPIGEIFLPQRRPTLLALSKAAKQPFNNELPSYIHNYHTKASQTCQKSLNSCIRIRSLPKP